MTLMKMLQNYVQLMNISPSQIKLQFLIRSQQIYIPKYIRNVLRTPKTHLQTPIQNGSYIHLEFDDMALSKSSKSNMWPILLSIINLDQLVICDAPPKAFVLNVKGHNVYFGCNSCIVEDDSIEHRIVYLKFNSPLRTNVSFRNWDNEDYHKGLSPFEELLIDICNVFVIDYMHNVCLGLMKRLLQFWVKGKKDVRLTDQDQEIVSCDLKHLKTFVLSEFCKLPRSLDSIEFWKATEFCSFLLYSGAIVLKNPLSKLQYSHFMLLHSAIKIFITENTCQLYNTLAK
ncbi:hypothetical protein QTP88_007805 [Uroleucon formosanum]